MISEWEPIFHHSLEPKNLRLFQHTFGTHRLQRDSFHNWLGGLPGVCPGGVLQFSWKKNMDSKWSNSTIMARFGQCLKHLLPKTLLVLYSLQSKTTAAKQLYMLVTHHLSNHFEITLYKIQHLPSPKLTVRP